MLTMTIEIISWWIHYYCILVQMDEILISSKYDCLLSGVQILYCIIVCYRKLLGKYYLTVTSCTVLLFIVYMVTITIHLFLLSFTVYTITVECYTVPLLSLYRPGILSTVILIVLTALNNNGQLTLGLRKIDGGDSVCILDGPRI